jgi:hypothetical protein
MTIGETEIRDTVRISGATGNKISGGGHGGRGQRDGDQCSSETAPPRSERTEKPRDDQRGHEAGHPHREAGHRVAPLVAPGGGSPVDLPPA